MMKKRLLADRLGSGTTGQFIAAAPSLRVGPADLISLRWLMVGSAALPLTLNFNFSLSGKLQLPWKLSAYTLGLHPVAAASSEEDVVLFNWVTLSLTDMHEVGRAGVQYRACRGVESIDPGGPRPVECICVTTATSSASTKG